MRHSRPLLALLILVLASCAARQAPDIPAAETRSQTLATLSKGGFTLEDLSALQSFLRHFCSKDGRSRDCVWRPEMPPAMSSALTRYQKSVEYRPLGIYKKDAGEVGVIYSPIHDRLVMVERGKLPGYEPFMMRRTGSGYRFTLVEGCVLYGFEMTTSRGKPYPIRVATDGDF